MSGGYSFDYVCEKFAVALDIMVAGEGSLQRRLHNAYISSLIRLREDDFPEELREEFAALSEALTWLPPDDKAEGKLDATTRVMSDEEATELASKVVGLFYEFVIHRER